MNLSSNSDALSVVDFNLLKEYYEAVFKSLECDDRYIEDFKENHPIEFSYFSAVARKRKKVRNNLETLKGLGREIYFGTLTFNDRKNGNKIESKEKDAFRFLNSIFEYFLVVEEFGEINERYHLHFVGCFRNGFGFEDFRKWHSRQNLERVKEIDKVCSYLVKYVSKELPRIRRNRALVALDNIDGKCRRARKMWCYDKTTNLHEKTREKIIQLSALDLLFE